MARKNPQIEMLETQVSMLLKRLHNAYQDPGDCPILGCGDNSCVVANRERGMATNGGCRCEKQEFCRALEYWKRRCRFLEETIKQLRTEVPRDSGL